MVAALSEPGVRLEAIEAVYRARYQRFLRVALALLGDREHARDAVQEAFARAIRARATLRSEDGVEPWLWQTLTNVCVDARRRGVATPTAFGREPARVLDESGGSDVRGALAALPERQKLALFLRHYADLRYDQIAEILGVERGTVAASLHAAHATLRERLGRKNTS